MAGRRRWAREPRPQKDSNGGIWYILAAVLLVVGAAVILGTMDGLLNR